LLIAPIGGLVILGYSLLQPWFLLALDRAEHRA
jgi:hypothetical protein